MNILLQSNGNYWSAVWFIAGKRHKRGLGSKRKVSRVAAMGKIARLSADLRLESLGGLPTIGQLPERVVRRRLSIRAPAGAMLSHACKLLADWADANLAGGRDTPIGEVTRTDASNFAGWLVEAGTLGTTGRTFGASTRARHLRNLRTVWNQVLDEFHGSGVNLANPWARRGWREPSIVQDWAEISHADLRRMIAATDHVGIRRALALARLAGLRAGECRRLRGKHVDLSRRMLTVLPEVGSEGAMVEGTKQRLRHVPIRPELARLLASGPTLAPDKPVCPDLPNTSNLRRALHGGPAGGRKRADGTDRRYVGILERAGVPKYAKPMHTLRRNCGTEWAEQGIPLADLARWMGNSVAVAAAYYVRTTPTTFARVTGIRQPGPPQRPPQTGKRPKRAERVGAVKQGTTGR